MPVLVISLMNNWVALKGRRDGVIGRNSNRSDRGRSRKDCYPRTRAGKSNLWFHVTGSKNRSCLLRAKTDGSTMVPRKSNLSMVSRKPGETGESSCAQPFVIWGSMSPATGCASLNPLLAAFGQTLCQCDMPWMRSEDEDIATWLSDRLPGCCEDPETTVAIIDSWQDLFSSKILRTRKFKIRGQGCRVTDALSKQF